jgi:hypothetical protein
VTYCGSLGTLEPGVAKGWLEAEAVVAQEVSHLTLSVVMLSILCMA